MDAYLQDAVCWDTYSCARLQDREVGSGVTVKTNQGVLKDNMPLHIKQGQDVRGEDRRVCC